MDVLTHSLDISSNPPRRLSFMDLDRSPRPTITRAASGSSAPSARRSAAGSASIASPRT